MGSLQKLTPNEAFLPLFQHVEIRQTVSGELTPLGIPQTPSAEFPSAKIWQTLSAKSFPLPWSTYVRLLSVKNADARSFYEKRRSAVAGLFAS